MPLKGDAKDVMASMKKTYGKDAEKVFYATANKQGRKPETWKKEGSVRTLLARILVKNAQAANFSQMGTDVLKSLPPAKSFEQQQAENAAKAKSDALAVSAAANKMSPQVANPLISATAAKPQGPYTDPVMAAAPKPVKVP